MRFVSREAWGAPAETPAADLPTARGTKVHWTGEDHTSPDHDQCGQWVSAIRKAHLANPTEGWVDIAYNMLACQHGYLFEGRGAGKRSGANGNATLNTNHYAICALMGIHEQPTPELLGALRDGIEYLQEHGAGAEVLGHQDGYSTDCPGTVLENWVRAYAPRPRPPAHPPWPRIYFRLTPKPYMRDDRLKAWQSQLIRRGYNLGPTGADGVFGPLSARALADLQHATFNDHREWDDVLGTKSWEAAWSR